MMYYPQPPLESVVDLREASSFRRPQVISHMPPPDADDISMPEALRTKNEE